MNTRYPATRCFRWNTGVRAGGVPNPRAVGPGFPGRLEDLGNRVQVEPAADDIGTRAHEARPRGERAPRGAMRSQSEVLELGQELNLQQVRDLQFAAPEARHGRRRPRRGGFRPRAHGDVRQRPLEAQELIERGEQEVLTLPPCGIHLGQELERDRNSVSTERRDVVTDPGTEPVPRSRTPPHDQTPAGRPAEESSGAEEPGRGQEWTHLRVGIPRIGRTCPPGKAAGEDANEARIDRSAVFDLDPAGEGIPGSWTKQRVGKRQLTIVVNHDDDPPGVRRPLRQLRAEHPALEHPPDPAERIVRRQRPRVAVRNRTRGAAREIPARPGGQGVEVLVEALG